MTAAVKKDQECLYKDAAQLYCEALDYFVPAIECKDVKGVNCSLARARKHWNSRTHVQV